MTRPASLDSCVVDGTEVSEREWSDVLADDKQHLLEKLASRAREAAMTFNASDTQHSACIESSSTLVYDSHHTHMPYLHIPSPCPVLHPVLQRGEVAFSRRMLHEPRPDVAQPMLDPTSSAAWLLSTELGE
jgi:hypothetical protein